MKSVPKKRSTDDVGKLYRCIRNYRENEEILYNVPLGCQEGVLTLVGKNHSSGPSKVTLYHKSLVLTLETYD